MRDPSSDPPVTFLYSDAALAVVDKPAGLTVVPDAHGAAGACLQARVAAALGQRAWVVHRLDRDTSGAVVFARDAAAHRALSLAFERRDVRKTYRALVVGRPTPPAGTIDIPLHPARRGKTRPSAPGEAGGRDASTRYHVEATWRAGGRDGEHAVSLVRAHPETGRHHQVRVHLRAIGHPLLGDRLYGRGAPSWLRDVPVARLALHASALDVPHPSGARRVAVEAPLADDLLMLVAWLDRAWTREVVS